MFWVYLYHCPYPLHCYLPPAKPIFLSVLPPPNRIDALKSGEPYLFGDCPVYVDLSKCRRYAVPGLTLDNAIRQVEKIPCANPQSVRTRIVVECGGMDVLGGTSQEVINHKLTTLDETFKKRFPLCDIVIVVPTVEFYTVLHYFFEHPEETTQPQQPVSR